MSDDQPAVSANRELATRIVAAFVRRHQIGSDQIPTLISTVHQALAGLGKPVPEAAVPRTLPFRSGNLSGAITSFAWSAGGAAKCFAGISQPPMG